MVTRGIIMVYKQVKIKKETDEIIDDCIIIYRSYHPDFDHLHISRDKILYEMAKHYLKFEKGKLRNR